MAKHGRGIDFAYSIVYDGLVWLPTGDNGTNGWTPDGGWGFHGQLGSGISGYISWTKYANALCGNDDNGKRNPGYIQKNWTYHDALGGAHLLNLSVTVCTSTGIVTSTGDGTTSDGSGYYQGSDGYIHSRSGAIIIAPENPVGVTTTAGRLSDSNGNTITNNGNGTFTDTLGVTALTIAGAGTAAGPTTLTYPVTHQADSFGTATVSVFYKTYSVHTNFQCTTTSGAAIAEYPATSVDLIDHITLPDASASTYTFTYEQTLGSASGVVTGRLKTITLPTGGVISYTYTGGCSGSGITNDGTPATLTRATTDGTKTYVRTISGVASTTNVTDEKSNNTVYSFISDVNGLWYETERKIYQGATSGALLEDRVTQYNGQTTPAQLTAAITQTSVFDSFNGGSQLEVDNVYDASGTLTSSTQRSGSTVLESVHNSYNTLEELTASTTTDSSGNTVASSTYGYDETTPTPTSGIPQHLAVSGARGNQTSVHVSTGSSTLNTTVTYYDTGVPIATTTPNGTTQYNYDTTQTFATTTTLPTPSSGISLSTSASYDQQSGATLSVTGMNTGQTAQVTQYDRLLRPTIVSLPNGGQIQNNFESANQTGLVQTMGNGQNADTEALVDSYGRTSRIAIYNGQSSNSWYQVDYCYDATGNLSFKSMHYQATGLSAPKQCSGSGTTYSYDALGRITSSTNIDGTTSYQYSNRAVKTTDVNGVQKITQYDLLGRISAVCEISSNASMPGSGAPVSCGMDIAGTGFITSYSYNLAQNTTTITQGVQSRVIQTDQTGRTISVTEPERGTTTYSYAYNVTGLVVTRKRPKANQSSASVLTTTTTQYDSLGRVVSITYDDGLTPTKSFTYDASANWSESQVNLKGNLSQISVTTPTGQAASIFSYDLMGWPYFDISCTPPRCGASIADHGDPYTHDLVGNILTTSDAAGPTYAYTYSPASEVLSITSSQSDSSHPPNLVSNVQNGPNGPISYALGNGLNVAITYDSLGRLNGSWVCKNSSQPGCTGGTQTYGSNVAARKGSQITNVSDNVTGQNTTYGYDEFNRLTSANFGSGAKTFSYVYNRYGNRSQQNAPQGGPAPSYSFNTNNQIVGMGYDAVGNLTSDGFHSYTYDAEGNLLKVDAGTTAIYAYDALNHRIRQDVGSKTTAFVYNAEGQRISYWNAANTQLIQGQVYWGNKPVSFREGGEHFQHQDYLGTERMTTNWTGTVDATFVSLPFGDGYTVTGSDYDQYHFAQLDHDTESVTDHAQFRQYSPTSGRWMSADPYDGSYRASNPQSFNRYTYAMNNPLGFIDPLGLCDTDDLEGRCDGGDDGYGQEPPTPPVTPPAGYTPPPDDPGVSSGDPGTIDTGRGGGSKGGQNNGRDCSPKPASAGQYVISSAVVAGMTAEFFSGVGAQDRTFGPDSSVSQVMAQSAGVQDALNEYYMTGVTHDLYTFGGAGYVNAKGNLVAQFVGSFRWSVTPAAGGINLTLTNTTSFKSFADDKGPQWQRHTSYPGAGIPMGNTHQIYNIFVPCKKP